MRVVLLHNEVSRTPSLDEQDVLVQADVVGRALGRLGHEPIRVPCSLDLSTVRLRLLQIRPDVVFNLVESLGGSDWLMYFAPGMLDAMGIPYTGAPTEAIFLSAHKLLGKERLAKAGLPTPRWFTLDGGHAGEECLESGNSDADPETVWIIKMVKEHASVGLGDESIVRGGFGQMQGQLRRESARLRRPCFAERFVEGREFNLSLLSGPEGPDVLPPAEIDFSAFPPNKPRIVGYRAKWEAESFEFQNTPRTFEFTTAERPLLDRLCGLARAAWRAFGFRGHGRVDFRVDPQGRPWILEVNVNPCLSPDAGFAAALERASISFDAAVERLLGEALREAPSPLPVAKA
jgi:D-alanine-D-alanine ligase